MQKIATAIILFCMLWFQTSGIYYCFKYEGVGDRTSAFWIPPYAWYKSFEYTYKLFTNNLPPSEKSNSGLSEQAQRETEALRSAWPGMTVEEMSEVSLISAKSMESLLTQEDIERFKAVLKGYCKRQNVPVSELVKQSTYLLKSNQITVLYSRELATCLLQSFDNKEPIISKALENHTQSLKKLNLISKSKLDADRKRIVSTAYQEAWTNEFGNKVSPLSRDQILAGAKRLELGYINSEKLIKATFELMKSDTDNTFNKLEDKTNAKGPKKE